MDAQWVVSSAALPEEGDAVEFVLQDREAVMGGSFSDLTFRSRWSGYNANRVRTWRRCPGQEQTQ